MKVRFGAHVSGGCGRLRLSKKRERQMTEATGDENIARMQDDMGNVRKLMTGRGECIV